MVVLALGAVWWACSRQHMRKSWRVPESPVEVLPRNSVISSELDELVKRVRPGMTIAEVNQVFGFEPSDILSISPGITEAYWIFRVRDRPGVHGGMVYDAEFESGRLRKGLLWTPI